MNAQSDQQIRTIPSTDVTTSPLHIPQVSDSLKTTHSEVHLPFGSSEYHHISKPPTLEHFTAQANTDKMTQKHSKPCNDRCNLHTVQHSIRTLNTPLVDKSVLNNTIPNSEVTIEGLDPPFLDTHTPSSHIHSGSRNPLTKAQIRRLPPKKKIAFASKGFKNKHPPIRHNPPGTKRAKITYKYLQATQGNNLRTRKLARYINSQCSRAHSKGKQPRQPHSALKMGYINIRGGTLNKINEIEECLENTNCDILAISETKMRFADKLDLEGWTWWGANRDAEHAGGGVGFLVKDTINAYSAIPESNAHPNFEIIWLMVVCSRATIAIGLLYWPHSHSSQDSEVLEILAKSISQREQEGAIPVLIGDFNAHAHNFYMESQAVNPRGQALL